MFETITRHEFRVDATLLEKSKAQPHIRQDELVFYKFAWYYHFKHVGPQLFSAEDTALICAASMGPKKKKARFVSAINDVVQQSVPSLVWRTAFWPANSDPCLLVADYCAWALQRKWEQADVRSYDLIKNKIATEYDLWRAGTTHYY